MRRRLGMKGIVKRQSGIKSMMKRWKKWWGTKRVTIKDKKNNRKMIRDGRETNKMIRNERILKWNHKEMKPNQKKRKKWLVKENKFQKSKCSNTWSLELTIY